MKLDDIPALDTLHTIQDTAATVLDDLTLPDLNLPDFAAVADAASDGVATGARVGRRATRVVVRTVREHPRWTAGAIVAALLAGVGVFVLLNRRSDEAPPFEVESRHAA